MSGYFRQGLWRIDAMLARAWTFRRQYAEAGKGPGRARLPPGSLAYGETPWRTMRRILERTGVERRDRFVECGSGTGRICLFVNRVHGIPAVGIEVVPAFVEAARGIAERLDMKDVRFVEGDFLEQSWSLGTIYYVTATAFDDRTIARIGRKCRELRDGARLAIVTRKIETPDLTLVAMDVLDFSWGPGTVFVYRKG